MKVLLIFFPLLFININFAQEFNNSKLEKNIIEKTDTRLLLMKNDFKRFFELQSETLNSENGRNEISKKSPWLAFFLSMFLPTTGQIYNGDYTKAIIQGGIILGGVGLISGTACVECGEAESAQTGLFISGLILAFTGYTWSIIDAPISANNFNDRLERIFNSSLKNYSSRTQIALSGNKFSVQIAL